MAEKLKHAPVKTGLITMNGDLRGNDAEEDVKLSEPLHDFKSGEINVIFGHAESWPTKVGEEVTSSLKDQGLIVCTILDEFQMNLKNHWGNEFR